MKCVKSMKGAVLNINTKFDVAVQGLANPIFLWLLSSDAPTFQEWKMRREFQSTDFTQQPAQWENDRQCKLKSLRRKNKNIKQGFKHKQT